VIALRVIGWLLVAIALALLVRELYFWLTDGSWTILPAGELWFNIHKDSLLLIQPAIERHLWPALWRPIETLLTWPAWAVIGVPGLLLALVRSRRRNGSRRRYFR
jgi:hypothetical protein